MTRGIGDARGARRELIRGRRHLLRLDLDVRDESSEALARATQGDGELRELVGAAVVIDRETQVALTHCFHVHRERRERTRDRARRPDAEDDRDDDGGDA